MVKEELTRIRKKNPARFESKSAETRRAIAEEEIVARACEDRLANSRLMKEFIAEMDRKDSTLAQKMSNILDTAISKIKSLFEKILSRVKSNSAEAKAIAKLTDRLNAIQAQFDSLLENRSKNPAITAENTTATPDQQKNTSDRGVMSAERKKVSFTRNAVVSAVWDALDHADLGFDNIILVSEMPKYVTDKFGIDGNFYIYRNHTYENIVSQKQAETEKRYSKKAHYHGLGFDTFVDAVMSINEPILTIGGQTKEGNPYVEMILPVFDSNGDPLYGVLSFYANRPINGSFLEKPHILLTISDRPFNKTKKMGI